MTSARRWPPPQPLASKLRVHAHIRPHFLPRPRGIAQSLKVTDLRNSLPTRRRERAKWVDPGCIAPECAVMTLPPSSPHSTFTIPRSDRVTAARPLDLFCLLFLPPGDRHLGLPQAPTQHSIQVAAGGSSFLALSLPTRKKSKGHRVLTRAHGSNSIGTERIAHAKKARE